MKISGFDWDHHNVAHIWRHWVVPHEVVEVFFDDPRYLKGKEEKYYVFGRAISGRYLFVVFAKKDENKIRAITARNMTRRERNYYTRRI